MLDSESNKKTDKHIVAYLKKSNHLKYKDDVKKYKDLSEWVKANIDKTDFKSIEEAEAEWNAVISYQTLSSLENKDYMDYLTETVLTVNGAKIFSDIVFEITYEYPEKLLVPKELIGRY